MRKHILSTIANTIHICKNWGLMRQARPFKKLRDKPSMRLMRGPALQETERAILQKLSHPNMQRTPYFKLPPPMPLPPRPPLPWSSPFGESSSSLTSLSEVKPKESLDMIKKTLNFRRDSKRWRIMRQRFNCLTLRNESMPANRKFPIPLNPKSLFYKQSE